MGGSNYSTMRLPAVCTNCGQAFPSGFALGDTATAYMEDCASGPCPRCGGDGLVPNGAYTIVEQVLAYSRDADMSREDMVAAMRVLGDALGPGGVVDLELLERRLSREAPGAADWVLQVLRDPAWQGVGGIGAVVAILIALFGFHL